MSCCENKIKLPCQYKCEAIDLGIVAVDAGTYKIVVIWGIKSFVSHYDFSINQPIKIPNRYNDVGHFLLKIYRPDGGLLNNTCFSFTNNISIPL